MTTKNLKYVICISVAILLLVCRKYICDFLYEDCAKLFDSIYGDQVINPYNVLWNRLRDKFISTERFYFLTLVILYLKPFHWSNLRDYVTVPEKSILIRMLIAYWQISFGDWIDRVCFDINTIGWNDGLVYGITIFYLFKTYLYARETKRIV